ncbi:DUF1178 family protein [Aestuariivita boseongensis]|uniref:DUF1178 family protein n=1 Tax=Aestuariivita boseongensis TaxID=1470562 RepID=UPI00068302F8|nr:DUF1178 family protein [Aestuariivita boseongensis]
MIQYTLKCSNGHRFDSWFQSASAFDKLVGANMVSCAICGVDQVEKAVMAPRVRPARNAAAPQPEAEQVSDRPLSKPATPQELALAQLKEHVEKNSDYVGMNFASEARAMHDGDAPARAIHGEARLDEAKKLIEDGVPVAPLPFRPTRKTN